MAPKRTIIRSTNAQLKLLVDYMSTNPLFAAGEFTGPLGALKLDAEWARLKTLLAEKGPDKTVDQWKHTWQDLKKKAREEGGRARLARSHTGNSVDVPELSVQATQILGTIGQECAVGIGVEKESGIGSGIDTHDDGMPKPVPPDAPGPSEQPEMLQPRAPPRVARRRRTSRQHEGGVAGAYLQVMRQTNNLLKV